jgi:peptidoglycan/LPS O-acetylase OafA/YrhL
MLGIEIFFSIVAVILLLVWIFSKGLTSVIAVSILVPVALALTIINGIAGRSLETAIWGFNTGIFLAGLIASIFAYKKHH